ncbi:hypothetical protein GCM10007391_29850 [Alteromonas halophila]|uniref:Uncharacterized protein n=1 Tax=Alteromonas halophila TaxID=516698 RepID=A0A918N0I9_9ALTE|nr:hypothetical protein GCM10007391_29850 [Alteromonas halophila]
MSDFRFAVGPLMIKAIIKTKHLQHPYCGGGLWQTTRKQKAGRSCLTSSKDTGKRRQKRGGKSSFFLYQGTHY